MKAIEQIGSISRRSFLAAGAAALATGCGRAPAPKKPRRPLERMIVLGVDGMDPVLLKKFVAEGRMPNCERLMAQGSFHTLATSNPPQSPVAWSNFISGTDSGGHGIFDFIARDPETMKLYQSTSRVVGGGEPINVGNYVIPTAAAHIENLRKGPTFWDALEDAGVDCTIYRIPANFPPTGEETMSLSGMGTPDLQGGYGIFTWFTDDINVRSRDVSGGRIERMPFKNHVADCRLFGPPNEFVAGSPRAELHFKVYRDPKRNAAKIVIGDQVIVLQQGEWSDWVVVRFPLIPYAAEVSGICRFYLKSVHRPFGLYVSPVNIDPADPSVPISTPPDYSQRLVKELGYFYTQGMIEDTHALSAGILDNDEYREQAMYVHDERMRFFEHELNRFKNGFFFFYFSSLDLSSHMFWRTMDPLHPLYSEELAKSQGDFLAELYGKVDRAIGMALDRFGKNSWVMVMSDHGFTSFRRQFNLNSWLLDQGYLHTKGIPNRETATMFQDVDWERTLAYGVGLNGLYLNMAGREVHGSVQPGDEANALADELARRLQDVKDADNDAMVIKKVHHAEEIYHGPYAETGPDLIVGYNNFYRASWDTILGGYPRKHVLDNTDNWSGDHCIDPSFVPGVLLSNRPLKGKTPNLTDLAPTILSGFEIKPPEGMTGRSLI